MVNLKSDIEGLICFYQIKKQNDYTYYIKAQTFDINNNFSHINNNCTYNKSSIIYGISSSLHNHEKKVFVCFLVYEEIYKTICLNYDIENSEFIKIKEFNYSCYNIEIYYFKETHQYALICIFGFYEFNIIKINENLTQLESDSNNIIYMDLIGCNVINTFSLIYSNYYQDYGLINDCCMNDISWDSHCNITYNVSISKPYYLYNFTYPPLNQEDSSSYLPSDYTSSLSNDSSEYSDNITNSSFTDNFSSTNIKDSSLSSDISTLSDEVFNSIHSNDSSFSSSDTIYSDDTSYLYSSILIENNVIKNKTDINKDEIIDIIDEIIDSIEIGKNYEIIGEDYTLTIKPTNISSLDTSTHVDFTKCEEIIRKHYNISNSRIITFLQMEIDNKNDQSLVNQVEYQVYDDKKNLLDLSLCKDIKIFYALKDNSLNISTISSFKESGIDIFNINDSFFNDICQPYSDSNNDIILEDRIKEIYQNYSVCDDNCNYNEFNETNMVISCDCKIKLNISTNDSSLNIKQLDDIDIDSNFGLIKCYNLVFSFDGKLKNYGFWIFLILVLAHIPLLFSYFYKGISPIKEYIIKEMKKYGYLKDKKQKKKEQMEQNSLNIPPKKNKKQNKIKKKNKGKNNAMKSSERDIITQFNSNLFGSKSKQKFNNNKYLDELNKNNKNKNKIFIDINNNNIKKSGRNLNREINNRIIINNVKILDKSKKKKKKNIDMIPTQGIEENTKKQKVTLNDKGNKVFNYNLININLNNIKPYTPKNSFHILNNYNFKEAAEYDVRSVWAIFYIFLLSKQAVFHAFLFKSPLESFSLRLCLLIFIMSSDLALNAVFYLDDQISKKYKYVKGLFLFTFSNNITIILLSTLIGFLFMTLFTNLSNSTNSIRDIFRQEEEKLIKNKKYVVSEKRKKEILEKIEEILRKHKIKVVILIIIEAVLMLFFWYYVTAFCHVYQSTQISWLLDSFLSILSRLVIESLLSLAFAKLYRMAVEAKVESLYNFVIFFYCFG